MMSLLGSRRRTAAAALLWVADLAIGCSGGAADSPAARNAADGGVEGVKIVIQPAAVHFADVLLNTQSEAKTVVVKNDGNASSGPLTVATSDRVFVITDSGCPTALNPQQSCTLSVAFAPDAVGTKRGILEVTVGASKTSVELDGTAVRPATLSIAPATQNFGDIVIGYASKEITFTVKNDGGKEAPRPVVIPTDGFAVTSNGCAARMNLPAGATCTVGVVFSPTQTGAKSGTLAASVPTSTATAALAGRGVAVGSTVFTPSAVDFGAVVIGKTGDPRKLTVTNTGDAPVTGVTVAVANSSEFTAASTCLATIDAGASCNVSVTFKPEGRGRRAAALIVSFAGNSAMAALSGTGLGAARLVAAPPALDFGKVPVTTTSGALTVTVSNAGDEGAAAVAATLAGPGADQFSIASSCDKTLAGGATCTIAATFSPTKEGAANVDLVVTGAPGGTAKVALAGKAVAQGKLAISPLAKSFGTVNLGASSGQVAFTVTNTGEVETGPLKIDKLGGDAGDFVIDDDGCTSFALGPRASCAVLARFAPGVAGAKSASLSVAAAPGGTVSAALSGIGLPAARLVVAPDIGDFGRVPVGQKSDVRTFTVSNQGGAGAGPVTVETGSALFKKVSDACAGKSLAPLETCAVRVQFEPVLVVDSKSELTASATPGGTSVAAVLKGAGVTPSDIVFQDGAGLSIFVHDFSAADAEGLGYEGTRRFHGAIVGAQTDAVTVFVRNKSMNPTGLLATAVGGAHAADFVIVANGCMGSLDPGAQCSMQLAFKPGAAGNREGAVNVTAVAGGTASLTLRGVGLALLEIVHVVGPFEEDLVTAWDFRQWPAGKLDGPAANFRVRARSSASTVSSRLAGETPKSFTKGDALPGGAPEPGEDDCDGVVLDGSGKPSYLGDSCDVAIVFGPQREGAITGTWNVSPSAGPAASLALTGVGTGPLSIQPAPVDFGSVAIGAVKEQVFTLTNAGPNTMTSVEHTLSSSAEFAVVRDTCPAAVGSGGGLVENEQCYLTVRFIPADPGAKAVTLTGRGTYLVGGAPQTATTTVAISGNAIVGPTIQVTPTTGTFADTAVGSGSAVVTFTVANGANSPPTGRIKVTTSPAQSDTQVEFRLVRNGCVPLNQQLDDRGLPLDAGKSCTFDLRFEPRNIGGRVATLLVQAVEGPGGTVTIPLAGNGTPTLTLAPAVLDLDGDNVNIVGAPTNRPYDVTITNHALYPLTLGVLVEDAVGVILGARAGDGSLFAINNPCTAILAGGTCKFTVRMQSGANPAFAGLHHALVHVMGTAPDGSPPANSPRVQVTGRLTRDALVVVQDEAIGAGAGLVNFGYVRVGASSAPHPLVVKNTGGVASGPLSYRIASVGLDNTPSTEMAVTGDCIGKTSLAPAESCAFQLRLSPLTVGGVADAFAISVTGRGAMTKSLSTASSDTQKIAVAAPSIAATPDFFGTVVAGAPADRRVTHTLTLSNPSNGAADVFLDPAPAAGTAADAWTFAGSGALPCVFAGDAGHQANHLVANGSCTFTVTFGPSAGTPAGNAHLRAAWCSALDGANRCVPGAGFGEAILGGVVGRPPALVVEAGPDGGDFGDVVVGGSSAARTFIVRNLGDDAANEPDVLAVDRPADSLVDFGAGDDSGAPAGGNFVVDASGCGGGLAAQGEPGDTCTVTVTARPSAIHGRKAELIATAPGAINPVANTDHATSAVSGNPLAVRASGVLTPALDIIATFDPAGAPAGASSLSFGPVPVGAEAQRFVLVGGQVDHLTASQLGYTLGDASNFRVDSNPKANPGGALPAFPTCWLAINAQGGLQAGQQCLVGVFFRPQRLSPADLGTSLTIAAQAGSPASVAITGTAIPALRLEGGAGGPCVLADAECPSASGTALTSPLAFAAPAGMVSASQFVFARNQSLALASAAPPTSGQLDVKVGGANASDFRVVLDQCIGITLDAGKTCAIEVRFEPAAGAAARSATLTVSGAPGDSAAVALTGSAS